MTTRSATERSAVEASSEPVVEDVLRRPSLDIGNRLSQESAQDIRWFFGEAQGALGMKAINWERVNTGGTDNEKTGPAEAAERFKRIGRVLDAIGRRKARLVQRFYQDAVWRGLEAFGVMAPLAAVTEAAKYGYRKDLRDQAATIIHTEFVAWLKALSARTMPGMKAAADDARIKSAIHGECDRLMRAACLAYETQKQLQRTQQRAEAKAKTRMIAAEAKAAEERNHDWSDTNADDD